MKKFNVNEAREIMEFVTPGPWHADIRVGCVAVYSGPIRNCLVSPEETFIYYRGGKYIDSNWTIDPQHEIDAKFLSFVRTALPLACELIEDQNKEISRLKEENEKLHKFRKNVLKFIETENNKSNCGKIKDDVLSYNLSFCSEFRDVLMHAGTNKLCKDCVAIVQECLYFEKFVADAILPTKSKA